MRKRSKKFLSLCLSLVMCLGLLPTGSKAAVEYIETIPCKYDKAGDFREGRAAVKLNGKWGFIDSAGKEVAPCKYTNSGYKPPEFCEGFVAVELDGKWGFLDKSGREVVPCKYDDVRDFNEGRAAVANENYRWGFIDPTGKEVVPCRYESVENFSQGLAAVKMDGKWGFIDSMGQEIVPCKYINSDYRALEFREGFAAVELDGKWGFIDLAGKEIVPCRYKSVKGFCEGLAVVVNQNGKWGFVDQTGKEVIPCKYDQAKDFYESLAAVYLNGKWGFIDPTGNEVIACKYEDVGNFNEGLAVVYQGLKYGFIDQTGKELTPLKYDKSIFVTPKFQNGFAAVYFNNKWGFIDRTGKEVAPCKYTNYEYNPPEFSEGFAAVRNESEKWGFIDESGKEVISCQYKGAGNFNEGLAWVIADGRERGMLNGPIYRWGMIDTTGKEVIPCKYVEVNNFSEGFAAVQSADGKWGYVSLRSAPSQTVPTPIETAKENLQTVKVDGKDVSFAMYSPDNGGTNYVRLVDLAVAMKGTAGQFNVGYDGKVLLTSHTPYMGASSAAPFHGEMEYVTLDEPTWVDGGAKNLEAIRFEYQNGGYTYYKLRDLGEALGFNVGWNSQGGFIYIESDKPYDPNN